MSGDHNQHQKDKSYLDDMDRYKQVRELVKDPSLRVTEIAWKTGYNKGHVSRLRKESMRQALETEQEPVAWMHTTGTGHVYFRKKPQDKVFNPQPVFIAPSKKPWVGLTDEEIQDLSYLSQKIDESNAAWFDRCGFARAVEQALKEKNT
jgi:hypothetical protein